MQILPKSPWRVVVSQVFVLCALRVLGQYLVSAHHRLSQSLSLAHLVKVIRCSATLLCDAHVSLAPSTGKSQVLLCAATFKFRGHLSIAFSWSLAFSRPKNGPDRTAGRSRTAKTIFHRSVRHTTSCERRRQVLDGPLAPLPHLQGRDTLCIGLHTCHLRSPLQSAMLCLYKHNT